ncbi:HAMP domain-containing sensor histidine kinase [Mesorhizobium sp. CAU 1732]|uniref:sensor histidine kinase n=1 Tax=Mesorhizobium sp. CAU 1732 TaxID=3140358 RepID=UPI00325FFD48
MLDLKTVLVVTLATASLQAVAWVFVWQAWRHLYELKFLAAGFAAIAVGLLLMIVRGTEPAALAIVLHNTVIKLGLVLLAEGLARFLGQPRYTWIGVSLLIFQVVAWSAAVAVDPGNIAIRIHTSTFFTVVIMSVMCLGLMRDRTQPTLLRWITIGILAEYMAASIIQSVIEYLLPADFQSGPILADRNAWYLLQGTLFLIAFFACLLFMVSSRLSADLREKNAALSREVQERRRLESRLNASLEAERALRDEQADFMRVVSHEFRTPLAIIRNAVDMIGLVGNRSPEATKERIVGIGEALNRLFSLIDRFMANDRDSGFRPETIRVGSLIADVRLHFEMTERGERLIFTVEDDAVSLFADPEMLATVLINLIDNAIKYSPENTPVDIDVRKEGGNVVVRVCDHGMGIPRAERHKIGRRFFRASNTMAGTGTGLGLYSSRKLLVYHGGKLQLLANDGQGMTAIVKLPLSSEATDQSSLEELTA